MAINSVQIASQAGVGARKVEHSSNTSTAGVSDVQSPTKATQDATVRLSDTAQSIKNAEVKMANAPDINQEKVDRLKAAIESGEYKINAERTAAGIIEMDGLLG